MAKYRKKPVVIDAWQGFDDAGTHTPLSLYCQGVAIAFAREYVVEHPYLREP